MDDKENSRIIKFILCFFAVAIVVPGLYFLRSIFIPITIAIIIFILIAPLFNWFNKKLPVFLSSVIILLLIVLLFFFGGLYFASSINSFIGKFDSYKESYAKVYNKYSERITPIWDKLNEEPFDLDGVLDAIRNGKTEKTSLMAENEIEEDLETESIQNEKFGRSIFSKIDIQGMIKSLVSASSSIFGFMGDVILVLLFLLFIMLESKAYQKKKDKLLVGERGQKIRGALDSINSQVVRYINVKVWISLLTAVLVAIAAMIIGLDFPSIWAVLAFVLNFIPSIGSILFFILITLFSIIQFLPNEQWGRVIAVILSSGGIEFVVGNIIDPKVSGDKLDLSPLTIMVSLLFWGLIWGIPGMFLSVPLMLIIKLTLENIPSMKPIAIFIGSGNEEIIKKEDPLDRLFRRSKETVVGWVHVIQSKRQDKVSKKQKNKDCKKHKKNGEDNES